MMLKRNQIQQLGIIILCLFLFACVENTSNPKKNAETNPASDLAKVDNKKAEQIKRIFYSLPSPMELSLLFKKEGVNYNGVKLHKTDKRTDYILADKKALNLGVYGADLSYAGLFGKHEDAIDYFSCSQLMADDLGVGQNFRKEFISRLEKSPNNRDTLLQVISDFFLNNDAYLKDQHQQDISTSILIGGWIEGMYLGAEMTDSKTDSSGIKAIIAGQKNSLENLLHLLSNRSKNTAVIDSIQNSLLSLNAYYQEIDYGKSKSSNKMEEKNGELVLNTGNNTIYIADSTLKRISTQLKKARSFITD